MTFAHVAAAALWMASPSIAAASDRTLVLEVVLNGRSTGRVAEFVERDGALYARPSDLRLLGLVVPPDAGDAPVPLLAVSGLLVRIDEPGQRLIMTAGDAALQPTEVRNGTEASLAPLTVAQFGAVLNYDILGTLVDGRVDGGAVVDLRVFGPYGVFQSTGLASFTPYPDRKGFVRLDTTYTFSQPGEMRRWRAGDVVSGALGWSRAVRLGGVQVSSDFDLRPDLITYPLPTISASAAVPSTVNILIDGVRQFSQQVQSGPFVVRTLPVVTGAGEVAVAVEDAIGRQTLLTLPFYASATMLKPGLASYSAELGAVRRDYGLNTDRYSGWAANAAVRYGLTDSLTIEAQGQATEGLTLAGVGAAWRVRTLGVVNASVSASRGWAGLPVASGGSAGGGSVSIGFQRRARGFNISLSASLASRGYRDLAAVNGDPAPHSTLRASFGRQLGSYGSLGVAYVSQRSRPATYGPSRDGVQHQVHDGVPTELVTVGYSVPVAGRFTLRASGFKDLGRPGAYGLGIGVSMTFGGSTYASAGSAIDSGRSSAFVSASRPAFAPGDFGYQAQATAGAETRLTATGVYLGRHGQVTAGVDRSDDGLAVRAGARGALVRMGGGWFVSDQIHDSFAVVRTGDVADVPVLYENRPAGVTNARGLLLVPTLLSYQNNRVAVDATGLPPDVEVGQTYRMIRPPDRSGVVVDFRVVTVSAAVVTLVDDQAVPIPIGSVARLEGAPDRPVGYDGQAYVTGLGAANRLVVTLPDGDACVALFDYERIRGDIPQIGPVTCR